MPVSAFDELLSTCARRAWGLAFALCGNAADADDVLQQAWIVAWRRQAAIPPDPWPWLAAVVANCARNLRRGQARMKAREQSPFAPPPRAAPPPHTALEQAELRRSVLDALETLPAPEREAVALCHIGGLTQEQASQSLGVPLNTVKSRARRGLDRLRETLRQDARTLEFTLPALIWPEPDQGWDAAMVRWNGQAASLGAAAASATGVWLKFAAAVLVMAALAVAAWLLLQPEQARPTTLLAAEPDPAPGLNTPTPAPERPGTATTPDAVPAPVPPALPAPQEVALPPGLGPLPAGTRQEVTPGETSARGRLQVRTVFYPDGQVWMQWTELITPQSATLEGTLTVFHPNGTVKEVSEFRSSKREGLQIFRNEDGSLRGTIPHVDGKAEGKCIWYHPNGVKSCVGHYQNDVEHGLWQTWHANEVLASESRFENGKRQGPATFWNDQGRKVRVITWLDGKRHGPQYEYDENGEIKSTQHWERGVKKD